MGEGERKQCLEHAWAHKGLEDSGPFFEEGEIYDRISFRQRPILGRACTKLPTVRCYQPISMYHRPDSAARAARRAVCGPARLGRRVHGLPPLSSHSAVYPRSLHSRSRNPVERATEKENCHPLLQKGRSGGENGRLGGLTDPGALVAERNATGNRRLGLFEICQCSGPNFSVGLARKYIVL